MTSCAKSAATFPVVRLGNADISSASNCSLSSAPRPRDRHPIVHAAGPCRRSGKGPSHLGTVRIRLRHLLLLGVVGVGETTVFRAGHIGLEGDGTGVGDLYALLEDRPVAGAGVCR